MIPENKITSLDVCGGIIFLVLIVFSPVLIPLFATLFLIGYLFAYPLDKLGKIFNRLLIKYID